MTEAGIEEQIYRDGDVVNRRIVRGLGDMAARTTRRAAVLNRCRTAARNETECELLVLRNGRAACNARPCPHTLDDVIAGLSDCPQGRW